MRSSIVSLLSLFSSLLIFNQLAFSADKLQVNRDGNPTDTFYEACILSIPKATIYKDTTSKDTTHPEYSMANWEVKGKIGDKEFDVKPIKMRKSFSNIDLYCRFSNPGDYVLTYLPRGSQYEFTITKDQISTSEKSHNFDWGAKTVNSPTTQQTAIVGDYTIAFMHKFTIGEKQKREQKSWFSISFNSKGSYHTNDTVQGGLNGSVDLGYNKIYNLGQWYTFGGLLSFDEEGVQKGWQPRSYHWSTATGKISLVADVPYSRELIIFVHKQIACSQIAHALKITFDGRYGAKWSELQLANHGDKTDSNNVRQADLTADWSLPFYDQFMLKYFFQQTLDFNKNWRAQQNIAYREWTIGRKMGDVNSTAGFMFLKYSSGAKRPDFFEQTEMSVGYSTFF